MTSDRRNILGFYFDRLDYWDVYRQILAWRQAAESRLITLVNPYSVLLGHWDPQMGRALRAASLVLPDGIGITHASTILGYPRLSRVTGPELMLRVCDWSRFAGLRHYFYGGAEPVVRKLADHLETRFPGIKVAGCQSPPFRPLTPREDADVVDRINQTRPDIVWVGLGAPKQEKWMLEHLGRVRATALIGVGAAFDFHARSKPWAPAWMRRCGIEWAHRLWHEPRRMWRRNAASGLFLAKVFGQLVHRCLSATGREDSAPTPACFTWPGETIPASPPRDDVRLHRVY